MLRFSFRRLVLLLAIIASMFLSMSLILGSDIAVPQSITDMDKIGESMQKNKESIYKTLDKGKQSLYETVDKGRQTVAETTDKASQAIHKNILNPLLNPSHAPPRKDNDNFKGSSWMPNLQWLSVPFSKKASLDDRIVLPPLPKRQPVYCYYDSTKDKPKEVKDAESDLLLTWRRAWWAQGFRPQILGYADAMNNPLYAEMQKKTTQDSSLNDNVMRWLAWDALGGGILVQHTLFPMAHDDNVLSYLRRGELIGLQRWSYLDDGIYTGDKQTLTKALRGLLHNSKTASLTHFKTGEPVHTVYEALDPNLFKLDEDGSPFAYYSNSTIHKKYEKLVKNGEVDIGALNGLVNAHLQSTWQQRFSGGIEVMHTHAQHMGELLGKGDKLAESLRTCQESPLPDSCPPNNAKCTPCSASTSMKVKATESFHNKTNVYTIGIVPHPWTYAVLKNMREDLDTAFIKAEIPPNDWVETITKDVLAKANVDKRVLSYKQIVAGEGALASSLWLSSERQFPDDLEWHFGFSIPKPESKDTDDDEAVKSSKEESAKELVLISHAHQVIALDKSTDKTKLRAELEEWSMADTEAWRFTRAMQARRQLERNNFEKEEAKYAQGAGSEKGRSRWSKWNDQKEDTKRAVM
ncbi:hypothetical protein VHEMI00100 [[Torrubiella] hemipterigena]|uniref:Uncharacterized protein n=1 Tax=[Torrubiella] hemipterigena TaxID=1531966 RepID=A0A0A1SPF4_9HYPO|nr:hypothetical protein VHEMI00100 [[Torrubiella] hemipterigena]